MSVLGLKARLASLDLEELSRQALADARSGKVTRRERAVKVLRVLEGMKRAGVTTDDMFITKVPVIPAAFRPYAYAGSTFIPGDANELYSDLIKARETYQEAREALGPAGASEALRYLRSAVRAAYGYDDSPNPKLRSRSVTGFLGKILGSGPKDSFMQSKLISKPQDFVGRGVISPDPELGMDEVGLPEAMAWELYSPHVERRLVSQGAQAIRAKRMIKERDPVARRVLEQEMAERPVMYSRAPAWHQQNFISGYARIVDGDNIRISPFVTAGANADFDGDTMGVHVPIFDEAVTEAKEKLLPSKMVFSIRSRDKVLPQPKHEMLLSLYSSQTEQAANTHKFNSEKEALDAVRSGRVSLSDDIEFP